MRARLFAHSSTSALLDAGLGVVEVDRVALLVR
jgi:hypothetical protein